MKEKLFFIGLILSVMLISIVSAETQIPNELLNQKLQLNVPFTTKIVDWRMTSQDEARIIADSFVKNNEKELDILSENLKYKETVFDNEQKYDYLNPSANVRYTQYYENIPVFEAGLSLNINAYGVVVGFAVTDSERMIKNITAPTTPIITSAKSIEIAEEHYNESTLQLEKGPELFIFENRLVWRLNILQPVFKEVMIDSQNGEIVLGRKNIRDEETTGLTPPNAQTPPTEDNKTNPNLIYYIAGIIIILFIVVFFLIKYRKK